jgi:lipid-A-disaccharide synthase
MRLFLSAGEPSGDLHGANLAALLKRRFPDAELVGFGGERMAAAGVRLLYPLCDLAVMWLGRVLANLPIFLHLGAKAESYFRTHRPDAVVLIDYPGFHWHIAQRARRYSIPVYYFVPPQLWAWAGWRVKKVRRDFRAVLTAMPFEEEWYRDRGVRTHYVGHPYFDEIAHQKLDPDFLAAERMKPGERIAVLPGSRTQEVQSNFPMMLKAMKLIAAKRPEVRFLVAAYREKQAALIREMLAGCGLKIEVHVGRTPEIIELATACIAVSGSVGLELLSRLKPTVVVYRVGRLFGFIARRMKQTEYISLVNLLAGEELFPEFAETVDEHEQIAARVIDWLERPAERDALVAKLRELRDRVAVPGAVERAAEFLAEELARTSRTGGVP